MTEESHCMYFVKRKRRYCRMIVKEGKKYCGEHQPVSLEFNHSDKEGSENKRIKCPLDPTQWVYVSVILNISYFVMYIKFIDHFQYMLWV